MRKCSLDGKFACARKGICLTLFALTSIFGKRILVSYSPIQLLYWEKLPLLRLLQLNYRSIAFSNERSFWSEYFSQTFSLLIQRTIVVLSIRYHRNYNSCSITSGWRGTHGIIIHLQFHFQFFIFNLRCLWESNWCRSRVSFQGAPSLLLLFLVSLDLQQTELWNHKRLLSVLRRNTSSWPLHTSHFTLRINQIAKHNRPRSCPYLKCCLSTAIYCSKSIFALFSQHHFATGVNNTTTTHSSIARLHITYKKLGKIYN